MCLFMGRRPITFNRFSKRSEELKENVRKNCCIGCQLRRARLGRLTLSESSGCVSSCVCLVPLKSCGSERKWCV